jgi:DNA mismatch repair ATPase MutS
MPKVKMPKTNPEYRETCEKFSNRIKSDSKETPVRRLLADTEYEAKLDTTYSKWSILDNRANELSEMLRVVRDERDRELKENLHPLLIEIKDLVIIANKKSPLLNNFYGFPTVNKGAKKLTPEEDIEMSAKALAAKMNHLEENRAIAAKSTAKVSVTVNELTKTNHLVTG